MRRAFLICVCSTCLQGCVVYLAPDLMCKPELQGLELIYGKYQTWRDVAVLRPGVICAY